MYLDIDITQKNNFQIGMLVDIIEKDEIIRGYISKIISNNNKKDGIKVQLNNGHVGRIYGVPSKSDIEKETFKFYNLFFNTYDIYTILKNNELFINTIYDKRCAYLYSSKDILLKAIENTPLKEKPFHIGKVSRKKTICELFKDYNIDVFIIDMEKQLLAEDLNSKEIQFRSI